MAVSEKVLVGTATAVKDIEELRRERKKAADRRRRIIFNNDGGDATHCKEATPEAFLNLRTTDLAGTHVDSIAYCTNGPFGLFWHNTKLGQIFTCKEGNFGDNAAIEFIARGTDVLEIMVDACKKRDTEIFWSMRMNDIHDNWSSFWYAEHMFPHFKREHPECLLGSRDNPPKGGGNLVPAWTAVDYGRKKIRDMAFQYIEEVCRNYDIDGIELDFFRDPAFFRAHSEGRDCGEKECDMMTGLIRRVRAMTEEVGLERGRPILISVRVPDSAGYCAAIGLDLVRWLEDNLVDVLVVSGFFRLNPWETSVELGHKYGVPVYPCLSELAWIEGEGSSVRWSLPSYRARAMSIWASGADGVHIFNRFNPLDPLWRELGDPELLKTKKKVYCTGARPLNKLTLANWERFMGRDILYPEQPRSLKKGQRETVELYVGENPCENAGSGLSPNVELRLQTKGVSLPGDLVVALNGQDLECSKKSEQENWLDYSIRPSLIKEGANSFEITFQPEAKAEEALLKDLLLWIRYEGGQQNE